MRLLINLKKADLKQKIINLQNAHKSFKYSKKKMLNLANLIIIHFTV